MASPPVWVHSSVSVHDLDAAMRFYREAFGFEPLFSEELGEEIAATIGVDGMRCRLAQLQAPGQEHIFELIEFNPPPGVGEVSPTAVGHGHTAFRVNELDEAVARVTALGAEPVGEPVVFPEGRAIYLREPGGSVFELSEIDPHAVS